MRTLRAIVLASAGIVLVACNLLIGIDGDVIDPKSEEPPAPTSPPIDASTAVASGDAADD